MGLERLVVPIEWKAADDSQTLEGYASTFGNVDLGGDVVIKGAFKKSVARIRKEGIPLLADHMPSTASVLGTIFDAEEDEHGLKIKARFSSAPSAQDVRTKLLEGHLTKMSIGYEVMDDSFDDRDGRAVRLLKEVKLWETSVVVFPMNPEAAISRVKSVVHTLEPADRDRLVADLAQERDEKATAEEQRTRLNELVRSAHGSDSRDVWVRDYDESTVWFELWDGDESGTYQQGYAESDDAVELSGDPQKVRAVTQYVPVDDEKNFPADGLGNAKDDESAAKSTDPVDTPSDEPGEAPDEGAKGWDRYRSQAVMNGRDPDAKADPAKVAGMATRLQLMETDVNESRDLLGKSAVQFFTEPTEKEI